MTSRSIALKHACHLQIDRLCPALACSEDMQHRAHAAVGAALQYTIPIEEAWMMRFNMRKGMTRQMSTQEPLPELTCRGTPARAAMALPSPVHVWAEVHEKYARP